MRATGALSYIPAPPRPLTLASSLRVGPRAGAGLLRKKCTYNACEIVFVEFTDTTSPFLVARVVLALRLLARLALFRESLPL